MPPSIIATMTTITPIIGTMSRTMSHALSRLEMGATS